MDLKITKEDVTDALDSLVEKGFAAIYEDGSYGLTEKGLVSVLGERFIIKDKR